RARRPEHERTGAVLPQALPRRTSSAPRAPLHDGARRVRTVAERARRRRAGARTGLHRLRVPRRLSGSRRNPLAVARGQRARRDLGDWCLPGYDDRHWTAVEELADPEMALCAMRTPGTRRVQELEPIPEPTEIKHWPESKWLYDLGQNMVGRVRLRISGTRGA